MLPRRAAISRASDCECRRLDVLTQVVMCLVGGVTSDLQLKMEAIFFSETLVPCDETAAHSIIPITSV